MISLVEQKMVLCYMYASKKQFSIYEFEKIILYNFKSDVMPVHFYKSFLDSGYINPCKPEGKQREAFEITELGKEFIVKELLELERIFGKLIDEFKGIELKGVELKGPFLRFSILDRIYKISIFLDNQNGKLIFSLPNNSSEAVEYAEYLLSEVLNTPEILKDRIKEQIDILKSSRN